VDGERLNAAILQLFGQLGDDEVCRIPSQPGLDGNGSLHRFHHLTGDFEQQRDVSEHSRACPLARHLLHRASEVEVDDVGSDLFHDFRGLHHRLHVTPVELYSHGALVVVDDHFVHCRLDIAHDGFSRYKFGVHHVGPETLAQLTESDVRHVFHRGEKERSVAKIYG